MVTNAASYPACAPRPLVATSLRVLNNIQTTDTCIDMEMRLLNQAAVNHIDDAFHRNGSFGNVGCNNHFPFTGIAVEYLLLIGGRKFSKDRQYDEVFKPLLFKTIYNLTDIVAASHEDQNVAYRLRSMNFANLIDNCLCHLVFWSRSSRPDNTDWIHPARNNDDRSISEILGKLLFVDGGRGDHNLQIGTASEQVFEQTQQEIDVLTSLV